jgi:hypothetical protein
MIACATHTFTDPLILAIICPHNQDQVISRRIIGVEQVRHEAQKPKAPGEDNELIFTAELVEEVLLVLLGEMIRRIFSLYICGYVDYNSPEATKASPGHSVVGTWGFRLSLARSEKSRSG